MPAFQTETGPGNHAQHDPGSSVGRRGRLRHLRLTLLERARSLRALSANLVFGQRTMKVLNSFKSAKKRHKECRVVRRKGRVYVINKRNPRFKARQG